MRQSKIASYLKAKWMYFLLPVGIVIGFVSQSWSDLPVGDKENKPVIIPAPVDMSPQVPANLDFAGEPVPMDDPIVREQLEAELLQNQYAHFATVLNIKRSARWQDTMTKILKQNGVPEDFFFLMVAESGVRNATSYRGAQGFWQFMPETAREFGLTVNDAIDERDDPVKATYAACKYLNRAYKLFKNWTIVAASYNMGMGGINNSMTQQLDNDYHDLYLNIETGRYVYRILALKLILKNPAQYGYYASSSDLYRPHKSRLIEVAGGVSLAQVAKENSVSYKSLRMLNPWIKKDVLPRNHNGLYRIQLLVK